MGVSIFYQKQKVKNATHFVFGGTCFEDFKIKLANAYDPGLGAIYESMLKLYGAFENDQAYEEAFIKVANCYLAKLKPPASLSKFIFNAPKNFDGIGRISPKLAGLIYSLIKDWKDNYIKEYWADDFKIKPFIDFFKRASEENLVILYHP